MSYKNIKKDIKVGVYYKGVLCYSAKPFGVGVYFKGLVRPLKNIKKGYKSWSLQFKGFLCYSAKPLGVEVYFKCLVCLTPLNQ